MEARQWLAEEEAPQTRQQEAAVEAVWPRRAVAAVEEDCVPQQWWMQRARTRMARVPSLQSSVAEG